MRRIIEDKFGPSNVADRRWLICGDFNDYRERIIIGGDEWNGYQFTPMVEEESALDVLLADGFAVNLVERVPLWTAGRFTIRAGRRSVIFASLITSWHRLLLRRKMRRRFRISFGVASLGARFFHLISRSRNGFDGRTASLPVRRAEARAMRRIIEDKFGPS
ncbi:hypothetical protein ACXKGW_28805, partial [Klebsiella pneumoniae subsp. pneumoniae]